MKRWLWSHEHCGRLVGKRLITSNKPARDEVPGEQFQALRANIHRKELFDQQGADWGFSRMLAAWRAEHD